MMKILELNIRKNNQDTHFILDLTNMIEYKDPDIVSNVMNMENKYAKEMGDHCIAVFTSFTDVDEEGDTDKTDDKYHLFTNMDYLIDYFCKNHPTIKFIIDGIWDYMEDEYEPSISDAWIFDIGNNHDSCIKDKFKNDCVIVASFDGNIMVVSSNEKCYQIVKLFNNYILKKMGEHTNHIMAKEP